MTVTRKSGIPLHVEHFPHDLQEGAIELQFNILAEDSFEGMPLESLLVKLQAEYPNVISQVLRILVPFSSTYLCGRYSEGDVRRNGLRTTDVKYSVEQHVTKVIFHAEGKYLQLSLSQQLLRRHGCELL
ncbi:hypothetical protein Tsp_04915 [Trichinella spiralis]|uniref:hypothetical protein n=1 Tax=Trichinella spiralis TaxID=6334 RepID=UPI0001EFE56E|nr:hypothetical protein Tsp_04915 [Trichinella spiralis]